MAYTISSPLKLSPSHSTLPSVSCSFQPPKSSPPPPPPPPLLRSRRNCTLLLLLTMTPAALAPAGALAESIPLFGLRKNIRKVEEEAEVILREGEVALEKGLDAAEKGIETAEKELETAEREIGAVASFGIAGDLVQAGAVTGAEFISVLIASSVVNGILGSEGRSS